MASYIQTKFPAYTPTMLRTYERCPHQFKRKYVEKRRTPQDSSRDLACGNAAHLVLQGALEAYRRTGTYPPNLDERVVKALSETEHPDADDLSADADRVVGWVESALNDIDENARVLQVERWLEYRFPGCANCSSFVLRHKIDLILEHQDGTLEHRDWKSGSRIQVDELQNVAARIVVRTAYPDHPRILSSTAFLSHGTVQIDELTRDQVRAGWRRIKQLAAGVSAEREWHPISNALCPWCPFYQRSCALYPAPDSGPDTITSWLEGAA